MNGGKWIEETDEMFEIERPFGHLCTCQSCAPVNEVPELPKTDNRQGDCCGGKYSESDPAMKKAELNLTSVSPQS